MLLLPKKFFTQMSYEELEEFIDTKFELLIGSHIGTNNNTALSNIIVLCTNCFSWIKGFTPSHIGSIISIDNKLYLFNMIPPKASVIPLQEFLHNTKDNFELVLRDFSLDTTQFSRKFISLLGAPYGYFSALQCAFKKISWIPNKKMHCSELHALGLQEQGYFRGTKCDDLTPVECHERLILGEF